MKLSIIIPTFNSSKVIGRALDSIVAQTFGDWEVLVMDGASKDNTGEIVKSYNDERIKFYSEPDKGIYDAMNKGIKKAQGEWLYFLGSDDWLYDKGVLAYFFRDNDFAKYDVVYGEADATHISIYMRGEWSSEKLLFNRCHQAIFYKKRFFRKHGIYNLKYKVWADHDINLRWYLSRRVKKIYVNKYIAHYSLGGYSDGNVDIQFQLDREKLYLTYGFYFWKLNRRLSFAWSAVAKERNKLCKFILSVLLLYLRIEYKIARILRVSD